MSQAAGSDDNFWRLAAFPAFSCAGAARPNRLSAGRNMILAVQVILEAQHLIGLSGDVSSDDQRIAANHQRAWRKGDRRGSQVYII